MPSCARRFSVPLRPPSLLSFDLSVGPIDSSRALTQAGRFAPSPNLTLAYGTLTNKIGRNELGPEEPDVSAGAIGHMAECSSHVEEDFHVTRVTQRVH